MSFVYDTLKAIQGTNIPAILVVAGIIFILLAMAGGFTGQIQIPKQRQKWTGIVGTVLLLTGLGLFTVSLPAPANEAERVAETKPPQDMQLTATTGTSPPTVEADGDGSQATVPLDADQPLSVQIANLESTGLAALQEGDMAKADASLEKAEELLSDALDQAPDDTMLLNLKGYLHKNWAIAYRRLEMDNRANEHLDNAEKTFRIILTIDAEDPGALNGMGSVYIMRGDLDLAEEYVRQALAIRPDYPAAQNDLELIQRLKQDQASD
jgi:hypothetical protein